MKIYMAQLDLNRTGGGWSFMKNFFKGMSEYITEDYKAADIYFITSPSMVSRDDVIQAKADGKKIVLRLDNAVRNSRNRNTGMSRMYDFAQWADLIVYQSDWAYLYLNDFLGPVKARQAIILNSVDQNLYHPPSTQHLDYANNYLYSRFNRDETKNWEVARYWFSRRSIDTSFIAKLYIVGHFSEELREGNFDFYNNEKYSYLGVLDEVAMASLYQNCKYFIYTYFNDACSNSLIEALVSGCKIVGDNYYRHTGGAEDIIREFRENGREYFALPRMIDQYKAVLEKL